MIDFSFIRSLRTATSERFIFRAGGHDIAALDVHYRINGAVDATLVVFEDGGIAEKDIPSMLAKIDEHMFPDISVEAKNLSFTVVMGRVLGAFHPSAAD